MEFRLDKGTGYMYSYQPKHPCANAAGKVMEHVYVVWKHTGQIPNKDECIHHKDRNKTNNDISNLVLMTQSDHTRLHQFEDKGGKPPSELICEHCEKEIITGFHQARICSHKCATLSVRKFEISKEELEELVMFANWFGIEEEDIMLLLEMGYSTMDIEELLYVVEELKTIISECKETLVYDYVE